MHSYKYKALNKTGNKVLETCNAKSKKRCIRYVKKNKGYYPIYIRELQKNKYIDRIKFF